MQKMYLLKNYMEICWLISRETASAEAFMQKFSLSQYEFGVDINKTKEMVSDYGVSLDVSGDLILCRVEDPERFEAIQRNLWTFYNTHRYTYTLNRHILLQCYLISEILWSKGYTNMDELADKAGYSRGSLREVIRSARQFLEAYRISVRSIPYYGIRPEGNEFDIRRCLISIYNFADVNIVRQENNTDIRNGFSHEMYARVTEITKNSFRKYGRSVSQGRRRMLNFYLVIQNARIRAGFSFDGFAGIDNRIVQFVHSRFQERELSGEILERLERELGFGPYDDQERESVKMVIWSTFYDHEAAKELTHHFYETEFSELAGLVLDYLRDEYGVDIEEKPFAALLGQELSEMVLRYHMGMLGEKGSKLDGRPPQVYEYPLIVKISSDLQQVFSAYWDVEITTSQSARFCELIAFHIQNMDYHFRRARIALVSRNASGDQDYIKSLIEKKVDPKYYEFIEYRPYEELLTDLEEARQQYDLVLCDQRLNSDPLFVSYSEIGTFDNLENWLRRTRNFCGDGLLKQENIFSEDVDWNQEEERTAVESRILKCCKVSGKPAQLAYGDVLVLIFHSREAEEHLLQVGRMKKKFQLDGRRLGHYILFAGRIDGNNIRLINTLLYELVHDSLFLDGLIEQPDTETVNHQLNMILR